MSDESLERATTFSRKDAKACLLSCSDRQGATESSTLGESQRRVTTGKLKQWGLPLQADR